MGKKKKYEYQLLKNKTECVLVMGASPYSFTATLRYFKFNGVLFGFADKKEIAAHNERLFPFTHIASGMGFPSVNNNPVILKNIEQEFNEVIEYHGRQKFWDTVKAGTPVLEAIEAHKEKFSKQTREFRERTKIINDLRKAIHITIPFSKLYMFNGKPSIDLVAFDDNLKKMYGDTSYPDNMSMKEFITNKWGEETASQIVKVL